jgi:predicted short-subunit dehydrogenase-like oxidoreductase (DUF2520 family)
LSASTKSRSATVSRRANLLRGDADRARATPTPIAPRHTDADRTAPHRHRAAAQLATEGKGAAPLGTERIGGNTAGRPTWFAGDSRRGAGRLPYSLDNVSAEPPRDPLSTPATPGSPAAADPGPGPLAAVGAKAAARPLAGLRFSLVGPGRVGISLSRWAIQSGGEMVSRAGRHDVGTLRSDGQDLLLVAVPDAQLPEVARQLAAAGPQAAVALHTSGSRGAGVLEPLRGAGCRIGALHPLKAFPRSLPDLAEAQGVFFGLDGDDEALRLACRLVAAWGGIAELIPAAARPLYHFAATLAAGGVATLLATAADLASTVGLPPAVVHGYLELARGTLAAIAAGIGDEGGRAAAAITGPVARGDLVTFQAHLAALGAASPERVPLALELARETLRLGLARRPEDAGRREIMAWIDGLPRGGR